jgi:cobalt-zinc-cadmium efflux system membrane fusion protein
MIPEPILSRLTRVSTRRLPLAALAAGLVLVPSVVLVRSLLRRPESAPPAALSAGETVALPDAAKKQAGIETAQARELTRTDQIEAPGVLALDEAKTARIGSQVDGIVVAISSEVGDRVGPRTVLASLHSHVVHDAWADYRKAVADRRRRETDLAYATQFADRAGRLWAAKALSLQERQRSEADRFAAEQELERARTEVRRAEEAMGHLGITNGEDPSGESGETIPVRAPIGGVVLEKHVTAGTAVTAGMVLFVVSDIRSLWALAEIDETRLPRVRVGFPVTLRVAAYPDRSFAGKVSFVGDTINPKTRRVTLRCQVADPESRLKADMWARISIGEGAPRKIVAVPAEAIQEIDGKTCVFEQDAKGSFVRRDVRTGAAAEGWVEVLDGVLPGTSIATHGSFLLKSELLKSTTPGE